MRKNVANFGRLAVPPIVFFLIKIWICCFNLLFKDTIETGLSFVLPMKSRTSRPSQNLPAGLPKKLSPFGGRTSNSAADIAPVSEFESPKLYTAGNLHPRPTLTPSPPPWTAVSWHKKHKANSTTRPSSFTGSMFRHRGRSWSHLLRSSTVTGSLASLTVGNHCLSASEDCLVFQMEK